MLFGVFGFLIGLFMLASPVIAVIAIVQWVSAASKKRNQTGYSDYQKGYVDGFHESVRRTQQHLAEQGTVDRSFIDAQAAVYGGYIPPEVTFSAQYVTTQAVAAEQGPTVASAVPAAELATQTIQPLYTTVAENAVPAPPEVVALTPAEKSMRMLNILLSLSSLLFIAAGIAFIASGFSDSVKLVGIVAVVTLFYGGGMWLYASAKTLKPAAVAFIGTGLGLIPFLGVAFAAYTPMSDANAWFIVSVVGCIAYVVAAPYLNNQIVSYLAMAFVVSLTSATVATAALPFVWYFVALISMSLVSSVVAHLKPSWVPAVFVAPVSRTGDLVTPLALFASLFAVRQLELYEYQVLFWLASAHYFVAWLQTKQLYFEHIVRALLHVALLLAIKDYCGDNWSLFGIGFIVVSVAQQLYSLVKQLYLQRSSQSYEFAWIGVMLGFQLFSVSFWAGEPNFHALSALSYAIICAMSALAVFVTRATGFGYVTVIASLVLPSYVGFLAMDPAAKVWAVALVHLLLSAASLGAYYWLRDRRIAVRTVLVAAAVSHVAVGALCIVSEEGSWAGLILSLLGGVLVVAMSHLYRQPYVVAASALFVGMAAARIGDLTSLVSGERSLVVFASAAVASYAIMAAYAVPKDRKRRNVMIAVGHSFVALFGLVCLGNFDILSQQTAKSIGVGVLLVWTVASVVLKRLAATNAPTLRMLYAGSSFVYYAIVLMLAVMLPTTWEVAALAVGILLLWELSYAEGSAVVLVIANALVVWLVYDIFELSGMQAPWHGFMTTVVAAAIFYGAYLLFVARKDEQRRLTMVGSTWVMTMIGFMGWTAHSDLAAAAAVLLVFGAVTMSAEGHLRRDKNLLESGVYIATFGLMMLTNKLWPELNIVFTAHLWAVTFAALAVWRDNSTVRYVLAMSCLTVFVGSYALYEGGGYSLLFLFEHTLLAIAGFMGGKPWALRWGLIASVLAIFYYLRDIPFVGFALLGALLVAFVVWRLNKNKNIPPSNTPTGQI